MKKLSIEIGGPRSVFWWWRFDNQKFEEKPSPSGNQTWVPLWTLYLGPINVRWLKCVGFAT